jgi:hypothetical protein
MTREQYKELQRMARNGQIGTLAWQNIGEKMLTHFLEDIFTVARGTNRRTRTHDPLHDRKFARWNELQNRKASA